MRAFKRQILERRCCLFVGFFKDQRLVGMQDRMNTIQILPVQVGWGWGKRALFPCELSWKEMKLAENISAVKLLQRRKKNASIFPDFIIVILP